MADKEPRRRKKRRDSQKKDDIRSDDHLFISTKAESRDSDQEVEEEILSHPTHQPSGAAKFIFVVLFSGLVISLSVIFISLKGADRGPIDIFDVSHGDHAEILHDEHLEEALHDDHDEHEEPESSLGSLEDFLPGLSSILSFNNEQVIESPSIESTSESAEDSEEAEESKDDTSVETEVTTDQGILEEFTEDLDEETQDSMAEESVVPEIYPDTTTTTYTEDISSFEDLAAEDFSAFTSESTEEPYTTPFENEPEDDVSEPVDVDDIKGGFSLYERADISNEADYEIRDQLDDLDSEVEKEQDGEANVDDNDDDDDDEEDDVEEEFDFWQF